MNRLCVVDCKMLLEFGQPKNKSVNKMVKFGHIFSSPNTNNLKQNATKTQTSRLFERSSDATKLPGSTQKLVRFGKIHTSFKNYKGEL